MAPRLELSLPRESTTGFESAVFRGVAATLVTAAARISRREREEPLRRAALALKRVVSTLSGVHGRVLECHLHGESLFAHLRPKNCEKK